MRYMLGTNVVSHLVRAHPSVSRRVASMPAGHLCISAVTEAELRYGLEKHRGAHRLQSLIYEFLASIPIMPWRHEEAIVYAQFRNSLERQGRSLAAHDALIAAHAKSLGLILVSNDQAFVNLVDMPFEDWTH
ncbi:type II toxin-antitoxin system VapC family toxin [Ottowia testudinis]|uniref:Ribonuclease VapC n=1 Tax=Ottowia testudinis TaxID=2816950 RepID=A0A975CIL7_9BURK|nr:type II toxin-antitoxin system VapC family toxin [Ottowia testudinis]QTD47123.1 type II toxin-antitoxin system VapC family toxin [Ottowia testudinis]